MDGSICWDEESHPKWTLMIRLTRMDFQRLIEPGWIILNLDGSPNSQKNSWIDSWHNVMFCKPSINYNMLQRDLLQFLGNCITLLLIADSVAASFEVQKAIHSSKYLQCSSEMITIVGSSSLEREYQCMWYTNSNLALGHWRDPSWAGWLNQPRKSSTADIV